MASKTADVPFSEIIEGFKSKPMVPKVLIVGQTGAGKTTLLNFLAGVRCVADRKPNDIPVANICQLQASKFNKPELEGEHAPDSGKSQTNQACAYDVHIADDSRLVVIDTPGFADTGGIEMDKEHEERIVEILRQAEYLNCILLVINGTAARLQSNIEYTMATIASLMPRAILSNVIVVYTFVDSQATCKFPEDGLKFFNSEEFGAWNPPRFYLQNPLGPLVQTEDLKKAVEEAHWSDSEDDNDGKQLLRDVVKGSKAAKKLLAQICNYESCPTQGIVDLKESKERVEASLINLIEEAKSESDFQARLTDLQARMEKDGKNEAIVIEKRVWKLEDDQRWQYYCSEPGSRCCKPYADGANMKWLYEWMLMKVGSQVRSGVCTECGYHHSLHTVGKRKWNEIVTNTTVYDYRKSDKDARTQMQDALDLSKRKVEEVRAEFERAVGEYQTLGLPDAFRRLMRAQQQYIDHCIESKGDVAAAQDMFKMKETVDNMVKLAEGS